jgi:hypothetical protein
MSDAPNNTKRKPEYIAFAVRSQESGPKYTRIGVGFTLKNGGISVLYDAQPVQPQIVLVNADGDKPATLSYSHPAARANFDACMVRDAGEQSYWSKVGGAWKQDGYISIHLDAIPHGKLILSVPKEQE